MAAPHPRAQRVPLLLLVMLLTCPAELRAAELFAVSLVGDLGSFSAVDITGNQSFTTDAIRTSLRNDLRVWLAGQPHAPRAEFLSVVATRLAVGYRHHGFGQATVITGIGTGSMTVHIDEGPRFHCGSIQVRGNHQVASADIIHDLATATPRAIQRDAHGIKERPASEAVWTTGEPVAGDDEALAQYQAVVLSSYRAAGFYQTRLEVHPLLRADGPSDLLVDVLDEGPAATVGELVVTGLVRTPRRELEAVLGLDPGHGLTSAVVAAAEERLRACGRFITQDLSLTPAGAPGAQRVTLAVVEAQYIPPLGQPLDEADAALLRTGAWTTGEFMHGRRDLVFDLAGMEGWSARLVIANDAGIFLRLRRHPSAGADETLWLWERGNEVALASSIAGRGVRAPVDLHFWSAILIAADPPEPKAPERDQRSLQFQAGWRTSDQPQSANSTLFAIDPVGLVAMFHGAGYRSTLTAGRLAVDNGAGTTRLVARAETGELEEAIFSEKSASPGAAVTVTLAEHAVEREIALAAATPGMTWSAGTATPWSSVIDLLLRDWAGRSPAAAPDPARAQVVALLDGCSGARALLVDGALRPLGLALRTADDAPRTDAEHGHEQEDCICIPGGKEGMDPTRITIATFAAAFDLRLGVALPASAWPRVLLRGVIGFATADTRYLIDDLRHADDPPGMGPLGCLALAGGLKALGSPLSQALADLGRERLEPAALVGDLALFDAWAPGLVAAIAGWQSPPPWFAELTAAQRQGVDQAVALLRAGRTLRRTDAEIMHALGRQQWDAGLDGLVRRALDAIAPPRPAAPAAPATGGDVLP